VIVELTADDATIAESVDVPVIVRPVTLLPSESLARITTAGVRDKSACEHAVAETQPFAAPAVAVPCRTVAVRVATVPNQLTVLVASVVVAPETLSVTEIVTVPVPAVPSPHTPIAAMPEAVSATLAVLVVDAAPSPVSISASVAVPLLLLQVIAPRYQLLY